MGNAKVSTDFSRANYTDNEINVFGAHVVESMTDNTFFPTPVPALADVSTAINNYNVAKAIAENGSKADTMEKNNKRSELESILKKLADYVQKTSNGDPAIILRSGMDVNKKATPLGPLAKPETLKVVPGVNSGSMQLNCTAVYGASAYNFAYTLVPVTPDSVWIECVSTKSKLLITGLISGKEYAFKATAVGADPTRNWSDIITRFVI